MVRYNYMKQGEFNNKVREYVMKAVSVLPLNLKPSEKIQLEASLKEAIKSFAQDIKTLEIANNDTPKIKRLREIEKQIAQLEQERIKILQ